MYGLTAILIAGELALASLHPEFTTTAFNIIFLGTFALVFSASVCALRKSWLQVGVYCVCVLFSLGLLIALLLPASSHEVSPRNSCANNMKQIGLALLNYENARGDLPPLYTSDRDGKPLQSWRTLILPYMEESNLYSLIDLKKPWDRQSRIVAGADIPGYHCPAENDCPPTSTSYLAIVGPNTAWRPGKGLKLSDIKDPANTILLVEMKNSGIHWAEPRDLDLENLPPGITKQNLFQSLSNHNDGFNALFADGHVEFIPNTIPWSDFESLVSITADKKPDRDKW